MFLKGRYHANKYTAQGWKRAIEFFEKAIDRQPDYALAYAGIATARGLPVVLRHSARRTDDSAEQERQQPGVGD